VFSVAAACRPRAFNLACCRTAFSRYQFRSGLLRTAKGRPAGVADSKSPTRLQSRRCARTDRFGFKIIQLKVSSLCDDSTISTGKSLLSQPEGSRIPLRLVHVGIPQTFLDAPLRDKVLSQYAIYSRIVRRRKTCDIRIRPPSMILSGTGYPRLSWHELRTQSVPTSLRPHSMVCSP